MSLNIVSNYTARINQSVIDTNAIKDITTQIFNAEPTNSNVLDSLDLSKFNRVELGTDLYSKNTSVQAATQIAVRNAGLDVAVNQNLLSSIQYLNSQAAQNLAKTASNQQASVNAIAPVAENNQVSVREVFALPTGAQVLESQNLNKDRKGSNPFSYQGSSSNSNEETENVVDVLNIFA